MSLASIPLRSRPLALAATLAFAALCWVPSARAHQFQTNLYPDIELSDEGLVIELWIATFLFPPLAYLDYGDGKARPEADAMREELESFFAETCPISIDGKPSPPRLDWLKFEEMDQGQHLGEQLDFTFAKLRFVHPVEGQPRQIKIHWGLWFPDGAVEVAQEELGEVVSHNPNVLDMLIFTPFGEHPIYLTKEEPEVIWHAPPREYGDAIASVVEPGPEAAAPPRFTLALAPVLLIAALIAFLIGTRKLKLPLAARALPAVAAIGGAILARDALPVEIPGIGSGSGGVSELTAATAEDTFLKLHRGIYRAFEADGEDAIYNMLAQSVDGALLDRLYEEIYQSLIMRDEGGAVSRVSSIDYLETKATPAKDGNGFDVECSWQVNGIVRHWGHAHRRTNEYQADYVLAPRSSRWKIAAATVNLQKRVKTKEPPSLEPASDPDPQS